MRLVNKIPPVVLVPVASLPIGACFVRPSLPGLAYLKISDMQTCRNDGALNDVSQFGDEGVQLVDAEWTLLANL